MAEFSIPEAAFTGFRVMREHPAAVLIWVVYALVFSVLCLALLIWVAGPAISELMAATRRPPDTGSLTALLAQAAPGYGLYLAALLVFNATICAAMALSAFVIFVLGVIWSAVYVSRSTASSTIVFNIIPYIAMVGADLVVGFMATRLACASAMTFDSAHIDLFGSWRLTRGRSTRIFATILLAVVTAAAVYIPVVVFNLAIRSTTGGGALSLGSGHYMSFQLLLSPLYPIRAVIGAASTILLWLLVFTPGAAIYRRLTFVDIADTFA